MLSFGMTKNVQKPKPINISDEQIDSSKHSPSVGLSEFASIGSGS